MFATTPSLALAAFILATASASPLTKRAGIVKGPVIPTDFADPSTLLPNGTGTWYAYSTSDKYGHYWVPYATSPDFATWTIQGEALPNRGPWVTNEDPNRGIWAPDVRQINSTSYIMYITGFSAAQNNHCIGVATSSTPSGPFQPQSAPILCDDADGGTIDPSGYKDADGQRYVLWKVDGNSIGQPTPIYIRPVATDGYTFTGPATQLITDGPGDGGIVEAPSMVGWDGWWYLFFSSNLYTTQAYDVSYAVSSSGPTGPFTKVGSPNAPLLVTGDCGTAGPGGLTAYNVLGRYVNAVFHSEINGQNNSAGRDMWQITNLTLSNGVATITC